MAIAEGIIKNWMRISESKKKLSWRLEIWLSLTILDFRADIRLTLSMVEKNEVACHNGEDYILHPFGYTVKKYRVANSPIASRKKSC